MSPNEQKITSLRAAITWARSMVSGIRRSMPCLTMLWVWPPQTSMSTHGFVTVLRISSRRPRAMRPSRYSSRYFTSALRLLPGLEVAELPQLLQERVGALRLLLVDDAQGEADVDED